MTRRSAPLPGSCRSRGPPGGRRRRCRATSEPDPSGSRPCPHPEGSVVMDPNATLATGGAATAGGPDFRRGILRGLVSLDEHHAVFLDALLRRDSARARRAIDDALAAGVPVPDIYFSVLEPALREIGHRWAIGVLNVAEEHYATAVAQSILDGLGRMLPRAPRDGRLAVVSGTPDEQHALGMRMVADFLEADGWEVLMLGPGAPAHDLAALVESEQPDVVALSTATAGRPRRRRRGDPRARRAEATTVHRRRRPVLDRRNAPDGARLRRRPRPAGPARTRRRAARADPAGRALTSATPGRGAASACRCGSPCTSGRTRASCP